MRDFEIVDQNLRTALRFFGEATGAGNIRPLEGAEAIYSGLDFGVFNMALLSSPVKSNGRGLEDRIAECSRFFQGVKARWSFWLCEDMMEASVRRRANSTFTDCGMRAISHPPGMLAQGLRPPERVLPAIDCRPVTDASTRDAFAFLTSCCFDIPTSISQQVYRSERAWAGAYRGYVGYAGGVPVSIVAIVAAGDALGVYSLATQPGDRRCGYGEAVLRAALAAEAQRTGLQRVALQSTEAGYRLYRRMGFREVTKYAVYLTK